MYPTTDYTFIYVAIALLPITVACSIWLYDRFGLGTDAGTKARIGNLELLLHKEISDRTAICGQFGMAIKQIVEIIKSANVDIQSGSPTDIKIQNVKSDSAANDVRSSAAKKPTKANKIKAKRGGKKRSVPRGNVTPFPPKNVQKSRNSENNPNV